MATKIYHFKEQKEVDENGNHLATFLSVLSWVFLAAGIVLILIRLSDFNDRNMYLFGGIGCIVASIITYSFSGFLHAAQTRAFSKAHDEMAETRKH